MTQSTTKGDKNLKHIRIPINENELLNQALDLINNNEEITTLWNITNVNAIDRLGISDHGPVHFQIVANSALRLLRILHKNKVKPSITKDFGLPVEYAELVVVLASLLHDTGMSIDREEHEGFSVFITNSLLRETLRFLPVKERTIVISEVLHAVINHRREGRPITIEGGVVRVADALDMSQGRSRIPYEAGKTNIHSISAFAIEKVEIKEGTDKPILVTITMNNSAGIFQIDELLQKKIANSSIQQYIDIKAFITGKTEKKLIKNFILK